MNEQRWLEEHSNAQELIWSLRGTSVTKTKLGRRKLRLYACGLCRMNWSHLSDPKMRAAVEIAERFADGTGTHVVLETAGNAARKTISQNSCGNIEGDPNAKLLSSSLMAAATTERQPYSAALNATSFYYPLTEWCGIRNEADRLVCQLLRDVFGNPFRPVIISPSWRSDTTVSLAKHIYESRDFSAMPILADALQDAGCDNEDILSHCRDANGVHVRGCWVVDLVLGKS